MMELERHDFSDKRKWFQSSPAVPCSICLELVLDRGDRAIAKLHCGHEFHLDCIGSAFNTKGAMQCPNCRKVEKGRWLYANGHRSSCDIGLDGRVTEDIFDLGYSEMPFGFQWCPFRGLTHLESLIEEEESQINSYHESEPLTNTTFGEYPSASSGSHVCPYLSLHALPHLMHAAAPPSSADSIQENNPFAQHPINLGGGQSSADMLNFHSFPAADPHSWHQQPSLPFSLIGNSTDQSGTQFGPRLCRSDTSSQQRLGSFAHPHPHHHEAHTRGHVSNHMYQQSMPSSSLLGPQFPAIRRPRPGGLTVVSSSAEVGGFGFAANSRSHQDAENATRHFDRFNGWGEREGFVSLPWIPLEGESQWWGPFDPSRATQSGGSFVQRAAPNERAPQSPRMLPSPRMPPSSYM